MVHRTARVAMIAALLATAFKAAPGQQKPYDPTSAPGARGAMLDLAVTDSARRRSIPIRVYLPADTAPAAVILFSHGLGGSREGNEYIAHHWSARGYAVVFLQHPGSDVSVWQGVPLARRNAALQRAASPQNFMLRVNDVTAVLDQLERWNKSSTHALRGRLDLKRVGMSGHSFGAVTTQAVSGQAAARPGVSLTESRIKAAVAFSPSSPRAGTPQQAFSKVKLPWMLMTGTRDVGTIGDADVENRLAVFPALPPGSKYELVLDGAQHSAFSDRSLPGDSGARNPNHHKVILALSTAFWDAYLREDQAAKKWLDGDGRKNGDEG